MHVESTKRVPKVRYSKTVIRNLESYLEPDNSPLKFTSIHLKTDKLSKKRYFVYFSPFCGVAKVFSASIEKPFGQITINPSLLRHSIISSDSATSRLSQVLFLNIKSRIGLELQERVLFVHLEQYLLMVTILLL